MPLSIVTDNLTDLPVDALVNITGATMASRPAIDSALREAGGPQLQRERERLGRIEPGEAVAGGPGALDVRTVIHAVGPLWHDGSRDELETLKRCYGNCLAAAAKSGCISIALPLIGARTHGFPRDRVLAAATEAIGEFLAAGDMDIYLTVDDRNLFRLPRLLYGKLEAYIEEQSIAHGGADASIRRRCPGCGHAIPSHAETCDACGRPLLEAARPAGPRQFPQNAEPRPLPRHLRRRARHASSTGAAGTVPIRADEGTFAEELSRLACEKGLSETQLYRRANIDRKLLGKILSNNAYQPAKETVLALALALQLPLDEALDFIGRAGCTISHGDTGDIIVEYFIEQGQWNIHLVNEALFAFGQEQLGR